MNTESGIANATTAAVRQLRDAPARLGISLADARMIAVVTLQLLLVLAVIHLYQLESRTFFNVMVLCTGGFVVHALLDVRYRLPFFAVLSFATIILALGPADGLGVIALGAVLIGICHLPIRMSLRVLLLLATGSLFALWWTGHLASPWSKVIWPVLASMFMFRTALYLYALRHDPQPLKLSRTLAYFFMAPNVCFPLFPVVDYSTFVKTYYDRDAGRIYYTGLKWITRGLVHLILYRFVYLHLTSSGPADVQTLGNLVQYILATFLLYLRVSGQFHLIVGVLHLFGFRLPDTHHLYYFASGFVDFWRRINIYWKEYMTKLVYYPSYFRLRRFGKNFGLVSATVVVFLVTWVLHSYQWFWLRGDFPIRAQDGLFWGTLAVLVSIDAWRQMNRPAKRSRMHGSVWSASLALRTLGTFATISVLWSLWSTDSLSEWFFMWTAAGHVERSEVWWLLALLVAFVAAAGHQWSNWETYATDSGRNRIHPAFATAIILSCILLVGHTALYHRLTPSLAATIASLQSPTLNAHDADLQHRGYYENLDTVSRMSQELWNVEVQKPANWIGLSDTKVYRKRNDFLSAELVPNARIMYEDKPLSTNAFGMRDRERTLEKPAGTYRIALLGPSHVMGSGVGDNDTFSRQLEELLNRRADSSYDHYEVLNFGIPDFSLVDQLAQIRERVLAFKPDVVIVTASPRARKGVIDSMLSIAVHGIDIPVPELERLLERTGARAAGADGIPIPFDGPRALASKLGFDVRMPWTEARRRIRQSIDAIFPATLDAIDKAVRSNGAVPVFLALDNVNDPPSTRPRMLDDAQAAGLLVFNLLDVWEGHTYSTLHVAPWDAHPNAAGGRLIAERLFNLIEQHRRELGLDRAHQSTTERRTRDANERGRHQAAGQAVHPVGIPPG